MPNPGDVLANLNAEQLRAELCRRSFATFVQTFWQTVTGSPYVPNRATTAIIAALQDVADGRTTRLLIAVPPGTGKTTLLCLYAAWRLARDAGHRSIHAAHSFDLAATESRRVRRLVESNDYQAWFPLALRADESTVAHWATTSDGRYLAVGTDGGLTGRRAHESVCDDPLNAVDRFSKAARDALWAWFCESLSTRLDGDRAPMIVVQQRLDRDDLLGRLIAAGGWTLVELPAEAEDGTLLAPNVLPREKLDALKVQIGSAVYACQYQQRPSSDENAVIRRAWWRFHRETHVAEHTPRPAGCDTTVAAVETPTTYDRIVVGCDLTFGSMTGDYAVAQVWGSKGGARYLIEQWRQRAGFEESLVAIQTLASRYPRAKVLVEKAASGAAVLETLRKSLPGVIALRPMGSKLQRLSAVAPAIESGAAYLPLGASWLPDFVEELAGATRHDDSMDCAAYALTELAARGLTEGPPVAGRLFISETASGGGRSFGGEPTERDLYPNGVIDTLISPFNR